MTFHQFDKITKKKSSSHETHPKIFSESFTLQCTCLSCSPLTPRIVVFHYRAQSKFFYTYLSAPNVLWSCWEAIDYNSIYLPKLSAKSITINTVCLESERMICNANSVPIFGIVKFNFPFLVFYQPNLDVSAMLQGRSQFYGLPVDQLCNLYIK